MLINSEELVILNSGKAFGMLFYVLYYLQGEFHNCKYNLALLLKCSPKSLVMEKLLMQTFTQSKQQSLFHILVDLYLGVHVFRYTSFH